MSGKELRLGRHDDGRKRRFRHAVLAALLALLATAVVAVPASADGWPHDNTINQHH